MYKVNYVTFCLIVFTILFSSCKNNSEKSIQIGCDDIEALADINHSIENNSDLIIKYSIQLDSSSSDFCGYILEFGDKTKELKGAYTDIDLALEIEAFFND